MSHDDPVATWWGEVDLALQAGRPARARRFLRWILAARPEAEEPWLRLAALYARPDEQLAILLKAYALHPGSARVQAALRAAHERHLSSASGPLDPHRLVARCLPRRLPAAPGAARRWTRPGWLPGRARPAPNRHALARPAGPEPYSPMADAAAWLAFFLPLVAYLLTLCPTVYNLDSAEFAAAAYALGLVRATGYPLYLLLGKAFTLLPIGDVGFRLNLMSAVCAAITSGVIYHLVRQLTGQRAAALAAALLLAFSYYFWSQAVAAEVYALQALLLAALLAVLVQWQATRDHRWLAFFGLLYGLSFGNHLSSLLLAPAFGLFIVAVGRTEVLRPRRLAMVVLPFIAGLSVYLYLPLRYLAQPAFNYVGHYTALGQFVPLDLTRPANIWWLVSGQGFRHLMFDYTAGELLAELGRVLWRLWGSFLGIGLVPGLLGAWLQARQQRHHMVLFGLTLAANVLFFAGYRIVDKETQFLPVYVVWAVWVGLGYAWLIRWVQGWRAPADRPRWAWALAGLAVAALVVNWPRVDLSGDTRARDQADAALNVARPQAIILGWWTSAPALQYLQIAEGRRPDVLVINRFLIAADDMYALIDRSLGRRPLYVMELDEGLVGSYEAVPVGPLFELAPLNTAKAGP